MCSEYHFGLYPELYSDQYCDSQSASHTRCNGTVRLHISPVSLSARLNGVINTPITLHPVPIFNVSILCAFFQKLKDLYHRHQSLASRPYRHRSCRRGVRRQQVILSATGEDGLQEWSPSSTMYHQESTGSRFY